MLDVLLPLVSVLAQQGAAPPEVAPEVVHFATADGLRIAGDLWIAGKRRPTVVCLPMYRSVRAAWRPLCTDLVRRRLNVLAIDLRGHGDSAPELAARVRGRDPELFHAMHRDVEAAIRFLEKRGFDPTRIGLAGASVGCSVAVAAAVRNPGPVRSVVLMTPGAHYLGVDTLKDVESWRGIPVLVLTSSQEAPRVRVVARALRRAGEATRYDVIDGSGIHGTRMFGKVDGIEARIAKFFAATLAGAADLRIPRFAEDDPRHGTAGFIRDALRVQRGLGATRYTLLAFAVGDRVTVGAMVKGPFAGEARIRIGERTLTLPLAQGVAGKEPVPVDVTGLGGLAAPQGRAGSFRGTTWVNVEFDAAKWFGGGTTRLALEFLGPGKAGPGEPQVLRPEVAIPADGVFAARLEPARR